MVGMDFHSLVKVLIKGTALPFVCLCYFDGLGPVTKLRLLKAYCSSCYGCEQWDLSCKAVDDFCIMWCKGFKRVWGLPKDTHSFLLAPLYATISIMDELCMRSCNFINADLSSDCFLINFVARQGIFYSRVASPLGRNTHFCCMTYGGRTQDISINWNNYINYRVTSNLPEDVLQTAGLLCELCFLRDGHLPFCHHVFRQRTLII